MPYTAAHGAPLFDAFHQWAPAGGATAPPVINDVNKVTPSWPQIRILGCAGWDALPETTRAEEGRTAGPGLVGYPTRVLGKTLVYECRIEAKVRADFAATKQALKVGFRDQSGLGVMTVTPWLTDGGASGGVVWTYGARVLSPGLVFDSTWKVGDDTDSGVTYEWGFVLTLLMLDPLMYTGGVGYP